MGNDGTRVVSVRMDEELWRLLEELGKRRGGLSLTAMLRLLVTEAARRERVKLPDSVM